MKATKYVKDAIEKRLNVNIEDCTILEQGRIWGESAQSTFDAAIVEVNGTTEIYKVRAWHDKISKVTKCEENLTEAFKEMLILN